MHNDALHISQKNHLTKFKTFIFKSNQDNYVTQKSFWRTYMNKIEALINTLKKLKTLFFLVAWEIDKNLVFFLQVSYPPIPAHKQQVYQNAANKFYNCQDISTGIVSHNLVIWKACLPLFVCACLVVNISSYFFRFIKFFL